MEEDAESDSEPEMTTGNEVLDGILLHSQQRMLEAIAKLHDHVHQPVPAKREGKEDTKGARPAAPQDLAARLARIEATQATLSKSLKGLHSTLRKLAGTVQDRGTWETDMLLHIQQQFYGDDGDAEEAVEDSGVPEGKGGAALGSVMGLLPPWWLMLGIILAAGVIGYRRYLGQRARATKIL